MTLWPARSEAIHWTRKRIVNSAWAASPSSTHQSSLVTKTSVRYAPIACDISMSKRDLHGLGNAFFAANEPPHAEQIAHADPQPIPKAVIGCAVLPRSVDDLDVGDAQTFTPNQCRQKPVQPVKIRQRQKQIAAERFQSAARIARAVLEYRAADRVGDARLQFLEWRRLAPDALAGNQSDARTASRECGNQSGDKCGVVLPVAVNGNNELCARHGDPGADGGGLSARALVPDLPQPRAP